FDPQKHLNFTPPHKVYTMSDIGLPADTGVSPLAVSDPFPLFTPEAVARMRAEILSEPVLRNCQYTSNIAAYSHLRGYSAAHAPFTHAAWTHPATVALVSAVAGLELAVQFDYEVAHVNLSFKTEEQKLSELRAYYDGGASGDGDGDKAVPILGWHRDSYPFVCVVMLSDTAAMVGGETALRTGTGEVLKVRGPHMGHGVVMQGRYIEHAALPAVGAVERITMVTSYRPRSAAVRDDTVLTTVRPISRLPELYDQFATYRLEMVAERVREQLRRLAAARASGTALATRDIKRFLDEQERFLAHTNREIVDDADVAMG
ncbi:hypothetical protein B0T26DRAFT_628427, partial [Lasiosphaeria miniovina]